MKFSQIICTALLVSLSCIAQANDIGPQVAGGILSALNLPNNGTDVSKKYIGKSQSGESCQVDLDISFMIDQWSDTEKGRKMVHMLTLFASTEGSKSNNFQFSQILERSSLGTLEMGAHDIKISRDFHNVGGSPEFQMTEDGQRSFQMKTNEDGSIAKIKISAQYFGLLGWIKSSSTTCYDLKLAQ